MLYFVLCKRQSLVAKLPLEPDLTSTAQQHEQGMQDGERLSEMMISEMMISVLIQLKVKQTPVVHIKHL